MALDGYGHCSVNLCLAAVNMLDFDSLANLRLESIERLSPQNIAATVGYTEER